MSQMITLKEGWLLSQKTDTPNYYIAVHIPIISMLCKWYIILLKIRMNDILIYLEPYLQSILLTYISILVHSYLIIYLYSYLYFLSHAIYLHLAFPSFTYVYVDRQFTLAKCSLCQINICTTSSQYIMISKYTNPFLFCYIQIDVFAGYGIIWLLVSMFLVFEPFKLVGNTNRTVY